MPTQPVYVEVAPPRPRYEARPARPAAGYIWVGGYWGWENNQHVWIDGYWDTPPRSGVTWVPAHWTRRGHRWVFVPGHWRGYSPDYVAAPPMAAAPAYAAPPTAYAQGSISISGYVINVQGSPVPGITITLAGSREGRLVTDGNGYYAFTDLYPGSYSVRATGGNCAFAPDVVNLNDLGYSVTQNITVTGCGGW